MFPKYIQGISGYTVHAGWIGLRRQTARIQNTSFHHQNLIIRDKGQDASSPGPQKQSEFDGVWSKATHVWWFNNDFTNQDLSQSDERFVPW